ncbi:UDP-glucuronosyltransferase 1A1-like [Schistocerca piceifrons]|uniref:UDP-glucuronosyltransferase 1A1-like n=1 Tax=Schistocerca piceifrons TaxID=274613 RepID=UPI001F5F58EF|nr:UDP-glucuronosyltransferase 1A1-like [Schistocerca piceifrons]
MRPLLLLLVIPGVALSARILGINPSASISHQKPFLIIMRALAERGHQDPPKNLTQIDMSFTYPREGQLMDVKETMLNVLKSPPEKLAEVLLPYNEMLCDAHFNHSEIKELLRQEQKFHLVIMETVTVFCYFGFVHQLGSPPVVGFLSAGVPGTLSYAMGDYVNPAYMTDIMTSYSDHMTFWQRLQNTLSFLSYQENMKQFSAVFREHQETSMDHAVWWVEYVIRHQGAPHLRSAARNLRWWQLLLLDVIAFILAATFVAVFLLYKVVRWLLIAQKHPQKQKTN